MSDQRRRSVVTVSTVCLVSAALLSAALLSAALLSGSVLSVAPWVTARDGRPDGSAAASPGRLAPDPEVASDDRPEPTDDSVCRLLAFAAAADPSLQRAARRSPDDIDAVADIQREALVEAARLLGPGPDADVLTAMARVFVDPGTWSDREWADALVERAGPDRVATLQRLEARCADRDETEE